MGHPRVFVLATIVVIMLGACSVGTDETAIATPTTTQQSPSVMLTATHTKDAIVSTPILMQCSGGRLAFEKSGPKDKNPGIYVGCPSQGEVEFVLGQSEFPESKISLDISQDGKKLLFYVRKLGYGLADELVSYDIENNTSTTLVDQSVGKIICCPRWSSNGKFVSFISHPSNDAQVTNSDKLEFLHIPTQQWSVVENPLSSKSKINMLDLYWSANDRHMLVLSLGTIGSDTSGTFQWDIECVDETGECTATNFHSRTNVGGDAVLSYDGALTVGYGDDRGEILITDESGSIVRKITLHDLAPDLDAVEHVIFSPNATQLGFVARNSVTTVKNIYILDLASLTLTNLTNNKSPIVDFNYLTWR